MKEREREGGREIKSTVSSYEVMCNHYNNKHISVCMSAEWMIIHKLKLPCFILQVCIHH